MCWAVGTRGAWVPAYKPALTYPTRAPAADAQRVAAFRNKHPKLCDTLNSTTHECFHSVSKFVWKPHDQDAIVPAAGTETVDALCRGMGGYRRLVFVGDSIMRNQANSLWALLGKSFSTFRSEGSQTVVCGTGRAKLQVRVDLVAPGPPGQLHTHVADGTPHSNSSALQLWEAVRNNQTLVIYGAGAHYNSNLLGSTGAAYVAFVRDTLAVGALVRRFSAGARFVYRTNAPGHPQCQNFASPSNAAGVYTAVADAWLGCKTCEGVVFDTYAWNLFAAYDRVAIDIMESAGAAVLDVATLSITRPDAHTAFRHGGGRLPPDCLHWSLPGVPDVWNALLLQALVRCR